MDPAPLTDVAHVIQVALTPVFLLTGVGSLLNLFNLRVSRVSDHLQTMHGLLDGADAATVVRLLRHMRRLAQRRAALDVAIATGALAGVATCAAAFALFVYTVRSANGDKLLIALFGAALCFTILALMAFLADTVLAWHGLRREGPMPQSNNTANNAATKPADPHPAPAPG